MEERDDKIPRLFVFRLKKYQNPMEYCGKPTTWSETIISGEERRKLLASANGPSPSIWKITFANLQATETESNTSEDPSGIEAPPASSSSGSETKVSSKRI
jgi:hypothetical protein